MGSLYRAREGKRFPLFELISADANEPKNDLRLGI